MLLSAIPLAEVALVVLVLSAGKVAQLDTKTLELTVSNLLLIAEELDILQSPNAKSQILKAAKRILLYGILSVEMDSMLLDAVPALLTVLVVCLILEFLARSRNMDVELVSLLYVPPTKMKMLVCAILSVKLAIMVTAQSAGDLALLECINVGLYVLKVEWLALLIC